MNARTVRRSHRGGDSVIERLLSALVKLPLLYGEGLILVCPFLIVVLVLSGCGGGGGQTAQAPPPPPSAPETYAEPGMPPGPPRPQAKPAEEGPKVELPENFSDWQEDHFKAARKEGGEKILKAVQWLGTEAPDKEKAAEILTVLLRKLPPEEAPKPKTPAYSGYPGAEGYPGASPEMYAETYPGAGPYPGAPGPAQTARSKANVELIRAICQALGANGTARADQTFREVLEGKLETDNDRVAQQATLEALVAHLNPAREDLLFAVLTTPEKFRPVDPQAVRRTRPGYGPGATPYGPESSEYGPGYPGEYGPGYPGAPGYPGGPGGPVSEKPMSAQELQEAAFALIRPVASEEFRVRLARYVIDPKTPQEDFDLFVPYLLEDDARNLTAQLELFAHLAQDPNIRKTVETIALELSSRAMGEVLGIPREVVDEMQLLARARTGGLRRGPGGPGHSEYGPEYGMESPMPAGPPGMTPPGMAPPGGPGRPSRAGSTRPSRFGSGPEASPMPGVGPEAGRAAQPVVHRLGDLASLDSQVLLMLASKLWSAQACGFVEKELAATRSLKDNPGIVLLASTIPVSRVRSSLYRVLRANWTEGPDPLEQAGILDTVIFDPGYLVAVKQLPRKMPKVDSGTRVAGPVRPSLGRLSRRPRPGAPGGPGPGMPGGRMPEGRMPQPGMEGLGGPEEMMPGGPEMRGYGQTRPGRVIPGAESADPKDRAAMAWMLHSIDVFRALADRLYEASQVVGGGGFSLSPAEEEKPAGQAAAFELPPNSRVLGHYEIDLARSLQEKVRGVQADELRIKFWRLEDTTAPKTILGFFRRKLGEGELHEQPGLMWLELSEAVADQGLRRTIDILIDTGASAEPGGFTLGAEPGRGGTTPSQIDILVMEFKEFAAGGAQ